MSRVSDYDEALGRARESWTTLRIRFTRFSITQPRRRPLLLYGRPGHPVRRDGPYEQGGGGVPPSRRAAAAAEGARRCDGERRNGCGGAWQHVGSSMPAVHAASPVRARLQQSLPPVRCAYPPQAILVVSAHWEEGVPTVQTNPRPPLLFDYYGFPQETYELTWPAPGDPALAGRVRALLKVRRVAG